jgi:hypothetical protein
VRNLRPMNMAMQLLPPLLKRCDHGSGRGVPARF